MRHGARVHDSGSVWVSVPVPGCCRPAGQRRRKHEDLEPVDSERGQASVELVAAVPALLLAALIALQLLLAGYALTLADGAAEAGALALPRAARRPRARGADSPVGPTTTSMSRSTVAEVTVRLHPTLPWAPGRAPGSLLLGVGEAG